MRGPLQTAQDGQKRSWLSKVTAHWREGTLRTRLAQEIRSRSPRNVARRRARARLALAWDHAAGTARHLDVALNGGGWLRLYGDSAIGRAICLDAFEEDELTFVRRYLRQGDVFVDVGANVGLFTVLAAHRVGRTGRVVAFEPGRIAYERLLENIRLNRLGNVTPLQVALSCDSGGATLAVPSSGGDAFGSLGNPMLSGDIRTEEVTTSTWDSQMAALSLSRPITMVKIDVEGWESRVLLGARSWLEAPDAPLLQVEFTEAAARGAGVRCIDLYHQLHTAGFTLCRYEAEANRLIPDPPRAEYPYLNLFATKNLTRAAARLASGRRWFDLGFPVYQHRPGARADRLRGPENGCC